MEVKRRTQAERSEATRAALVEAARALFGAEGYAAVGTTALARAAGVSRGALYHQFADKAELFAAVVEVVEEDLVAGMVERVSAPGASEANLLEVGVEAWLDVCAQPEVQQIVLLDGPVVLGWDRWREVGLRHGGGLVEAAVTEAMADGTIAEAPVRPLVHVLIGALDEAALYVAQADDPATARAEVTAALHRLVSGLSRSG